MELPPRRPGQSTSFGATKSAFRAPSSASSASFHFDVDRARERGAALWQHIPQAADRWPALAPSPHEQGVLHFRMSTPVHWFLAQLSVAEFLLAYSLGSFDTSSLPPFPVPPFAREGETLAPSATHENVARGLPTSTEYGSTVLDNAAGRLVDAFMETRAAYQRHAVSRAGRFAGAMSGINGEAASSFGPAFSTAMSDEVEDTESAVDALEDAAVGSVVEAHVSMIRFFSSLFNTCLPAPFPMYVLNSAPALLDRCPWTDLVCCQL